MRWLRWLPAVLVLLPWLLGPAIPSNEARVRDPGRPVTFRLLDWETVALGSARAPVGGLIGPTLSASPMPTRCARSSARTRPVGPPPSRRSSVSSPGLCRRRAQPFGSRSPPDRLFPPVLVALTPPPNVLVVAPRTELRVFSRSVLKSMDVSAQEQLETSTDSTGVSSLVAPIGGLATYPVDGARRRFAPSASCPRSRTSGCTST